VVIHDGVDIAVVEAVPLSVNGVLTVGWEGDIHSRTMVTLTQDKGLTQE
jgi:hypothetical protein